MSAAHTPESAPASPEIDTSRPVEFEGNGERLQFIGRLPYEPRPLVFWHPHVGICEFNTRGEPQPGASYTKPIHNVPEEPKPVMSNEPESRADEDGAVLAIRKVREALKPFAYMVAGRSPPLEDHDEVFVRWGYLRAADQALTDLDESLAIEFLRRTPSPPDGMRKALELARGRLEIYLDTVTELHAKAGDGDPKLAIAFRRDHERFMAKIEGLASSPRPEDQ